MTINPYDKGDIVRVPGIFTDENDVLIDPLVVHFSYRHEAGPTTTLTYNVDAEVIRDSAGTYRADIDTTLAGMWFWRWWSTGAGQASDEGQFYVRPVHVAEPEP